MSVDMTLERPEPRKQVRPHDAVGGNDLAYGQFVIVTARWILVAAGLLLALWLAESVETLRLKVPVILLLAVGNFYVHAGLLRKRPLRDEIAQLASAADI